MKKGRNAAFGALIVLLASILVSPDVSAADPLRITKEELKQRLGNPEIVIVDVRSGRDWTGSERKIAGAVREEPNDVGGWEKRYPKNKPMILYCA
jgi:rhodanese-related sulfurtransferase